MSTLIPRLARQVLKRYYYTYWPGQAGVVPYFCTRVFFQPRSHLFLRLCQEDIYELGNLRVIRQFVTPETTYLDVGANIGLMSVPILRDCPTARVVSFEPSPNSVPYLEKTHATSPFRDRWQIVPKAAGREVGSLNFYCSSPADSAFDGLKGTRRAGLRSLTTIAVTTVDTEWHALGCPPVSVLKIDVEGAEMDVIQGAVECIHAHRPVILTEWNAENLAAFGRPPESLLEWTRSHDYDLVSLPDGIRVTSTREFRLRMLGTEDFALLPGEP